VVQGAVLVGQPRHDQAPVRVRRYSGAGSVDEQDWRAGADVVAIRREFTELDGPCDLQVALRLLFQRRTFLVDPVEPEWEPTPARATPRTHPAGRRS
jgi:hypothetical protein